MAKEKRAGHGVPYGEIADKAREAVTRLGCADMKTIWPGVGEFMRRQNAAEALRRTPGVVELFPSVFAREDVALSIRAIIDAAKTK